LLNFKLKHAADFLCLKKICSCVWRTRTSLWLQCLSPCYRHSKCYIVKQSRYRPGVAQRVPES